MEHYIKCNNCETMIEKMYKMCYSCENTKIYTVDGLIDKTYSIDKTNDLIDESFENAKKEYSNYLEKIKMLYIKVFINGKEISGFVDTGAETSVMFINVAKECKLTSLIDERCAGTIVGVTNERSTLGKLHYVKLNINNKDYYSSFTVIDNNVDKLEIIIGLDFLRRYQGNIDLIQNCLYLDGIKCFFN